MSLVTAIDIGSHSLKWVRVDCAGQRPVVRDWGRELLEEGTLTGNFNKLGLRKPALFRDALEKTIGQAAVAGGEVALTFPDQFIKVFFTEMDRLQDLTAKERQYTIWRLRQQLPASIVKECILDYQHLITLRRDTGPVFKVVVEAIREDILNELARRVARQKAWPAFTNANSFCCFNLFENILDKEAPAETPICLLHIGHYSTTFSFFRNGVLEYVRILDFAWHNFVEICTRVSNCSREEALTKLTEEELLPETGKAPTAGLKGISLFCELFEEWFREIEQTFSFHKSNHPYIDKPRVYLTGGGAALKNLSSFLSKLLNAPVQLLDPGESFNMETVAELNERLGLSAALGAALSWGKKDEETLPVATRVETAVQEVSQ